METRERAQTMQFSMHELVLTTLLQELVVHSTEYHDRIERVFIV